VSERSVQCPRCLFSFARLVDAGDFHAYRCPTCDWTRETTDRRPGNRPADVCALCDTAIDLTGSNHHLYVGPGWIYGGGREYIPIHRLCADTIRAFLRTGTMHNDGCSCSYEPSNGGHFYGCQHYEGNAA